MFIEEQVCTMNQGRECNTPYNIRMYSDDSMDKVLKVIYHNKNTVDIFNYDDDDVLIQKDSVCLEYFYSSRSCTPITTYYEYNEDGSVDTIKSTKFNIKYIYDEYGRLIEKTNNGIINFRFIYDDTKYTRKKLKYSNERIVDCKIYYTDENDDLIKYESVDNDGNVLFVTTYVRDILGRNREKITLDAKSGNIIKKIEYRYYIEV